MSIDKVSISDIKEYLKLSGQKLSKDEKQKLNSIFAKVDTENDSVVNDDENKTGDGFLNEKEWGVFKGVVEECYGIFNKIKIFCVKTDEDFKNDANSEQLESEEYNYFADNNKFSREMFTNESLEKSFPNCQITVEDDYVEVRDASGETLLQVLNLDKSPRIIYSQGDKSVVLRYNMFDSLIEKKENQDTTYYSNGKKTRVEKNGLEIYFDGDEQVRKIVDVYNRTETHYENGEISRIVDANTGVKTEVLPNGKTKTGYDGKTVATLYGEDDFNYKIIKKLSEEEFNDFVDNFNFIESFWKMSPEKIEYFFDVFISKLEKEGGYTEDIKGLASQLLSTFNVTKSDPTTYDAFVLHVKGRMRSLDNDKPVELKEPNGKIDANFKQGVTGDCWLLSSIKALASKEKGLDLLNSMITIQKDGDTLKSVTVNIQGKDYVISKDELYAANEYSTGDLDVRAIEIAANRYCYENGYKDITAGANVEFGFSLLIGDGQKSSGFMSNFINEQFVEDIKSGDKVCIVGGAYKDKKAINIETGEPVSIFQNHAYTVVGYDDSFVLLANPHDSSQTLKLAIEDLSSTFIRGCSFDIPEKTND
ncbi:hypothetical protein IKL64_01240 [bacterium]|nr:hypothetical protein [bacterium]